MHDLVHDLALYVAQEDSVVVTLHSSSVNEKGRSAALGNEKLLLEGGISQSKLKTEKLRTILTPQHLIKPTTSAQMHVWCSKFKHLRVLQLCSIFRKKIPESIGDLVHLRYLDLSYNTLLRELPKSICKLHQLQSLLLKYCDDLQELPSNIRYMISLRYFFLTTRQRQLEGIKYLTSLHTLEILKCHNLVTLPKDMQNLTHLRTLIISRCPSLASLPSTMKYLTRLENLVIDDAIKLKLEEFDGGFKNLKSFTVSFLDQLVALPQWLGNSLRLQKLQIACCYSLSSLPEGLHHLSELKKLEIHHCPKLSQRCQPQIGEDWQNIAHVQEIHLDNKMISPADYEGRHLPVCLMS